MGNIPSERSQLLTFARSHFQVWIDQAANIGLAPADAMAVKTALNATDAQIGAVGVARSAAKAATMQLGENYVDLRDAVSDAVRLINIFADDSADPENVYIKAQIDPPAPRGVTPPPNEATNLLVSLNATDGSITLRWKASQPDGVFGVVYNVRRRIGSSGPLTLVGATGEKRFDDATIPSGTALLSYTVTSQRGSQVSAPSAAIEVRFGVAPGGGLTIESVTDGENAEELKAAA